MRTLKDALWNVPERQVPEPRVSAPRSQHAVYKLQLFSEGGALKDEDIHLGNLGHFDK